MLYFQALHPDQDDSGPEEGFEDPHDGDEGEEPGMFDDAEEDIGENGDHGPEQMDAD